LLSRSSISSTTIASEYASSPVAHPGDPDPQRRALFPRVEDLREAGVHQRLERLRVAKEPGHPDQPVPPQRVDLGIVVLQIARVICDASDAVEAHASPDATHERLALVGGEVVAAAQADQGKDPLQLGRRSRGVFVAALRRDRVANVRAQVRGHLVD
jgi:hypothetical protein